MPSRLEGEGAKRQINQWALGVALTGWPRNWELIRKSQQADLKSLWQALSQFFL